MFTLWERCGFTAMKRSARAQPASFRALMVESSAASVATSATAFSFRRRSASGSMTVMSLDSWLSILARWEPTSPAPSMIIFIIKSFKLQI